MIGAHMDSWHSGTGATDNGAGVAATMEAVRILKALKLQPRRTIRIALWTGEEQGLFGSKAYVAKHFGKLEPATQPASTPATRPVGARPTTGPTTARSSRPVKKLMREEEYERLSVYFNLDNGTGKIRGVYMQGNEAVRPIFRKWLAPLADLGAQTLTLTNTGGTDHIPFDAIGLPAFQFIQDPIEYWSRTHHSNQDVYDRVQEEDLKQASTIMAAFIYEAAMRDEKLPRKELKLGE
jgi:Zn-dependent M28 family amino/carboxypeptidase